MICFASNVQINSQYRKTESMRITNERNSSTTSCFFINSRILTKKNKKAAAGLKVYDLPLKNRNVLDGCLRLVTILNIHVSFGITFETDINILQMQK